MPYTYSIGCFAFMMVWRRTKNELFVAVSSILASKAKKRQVSQKNIFVIKCFSVEAKKTATSNENENM